MGEENKFRSHQQKEKFSCVQESVSCRGPFESDPGRAVSGDSKVIILKFCHHSVLSFLDEATRIAPERVQKFEIWNFFPVHVKGEFEC